MGMLNNQYNNNNGVEFTDERSVLHSRFEPSIKIPAQVEWVIRHSGGLVQNEQQARYVLMVSIGVAVIVSIFLFTSLGPDTGNDPLDPSVHPVILRPQ